MRWLVLILVACLAMALLKATIIALLLIFGLMILWGVFFRPAETFGFIALTGFMSLLEQRPLPVLLVIGLLGLVALLQRPDPKAEPPPLLTDQTGNES